MTRIEEVKAEKKRRGATTSPEVACNNSYKKIAESTSIGFSGGRVGRIICTRSNGRYKFMFAYINMLMPLVGLGTPTMKDIDGVVKNGGSWRAL